MPPKKPPANASRKKGQAPISCDLEIPIEEPGEQSLPDVHSPFRKLKLRVSATPEDWRDLYAELHGDPETLGSRLLQSIEDFYAENIAPLDLNPPPRGKHTEVEKAFMDESRRYVAACIAVFRFWEGSGMPWPEHLSNAIKSLPDKKTLRDGRTAAKKLIPEKIARALWIKQFADRAKSLSMSIPSNYKAFRATYVDDNPFIEWSDRIIERLANPDKRRITAMEDLNIPPEKVESWAIVDCDIDDPEDIRLLMDDISIEDLTIDILADCLA